MSSARIDAKLAAGAQSVLSGTDDARLTNDELRRKYEVTVEIPSSPRLGASPGSLKSRHSAVLPSFQQTLLLPTFRCFACDTNLRDPGVGWFACGACGAMNGEGEPRINRAFDGCVFRGMCRRLSRHGRAVVLAVIGLIAYVIVEGVTCLLPLLVDQSSPWTRASLLHRGLTCVLASGTAFNYAATLLTRPGIIEHELNPLRRSEAEAKPRGAKEKDEADTQSDLPLEIVRPLPLSSDNPAPRSRTSTQTSTQALGTAHNVGMLMPLSQLVALRGEQPLRGWKRCPETGQSLPPRAHYCR